MPYDYDYFISYAHADNASEDGKPGFVDEFVNKLRNSPEHQQMFGEKVNVFFDKTEIHSMSDWDNNIRSNLASSRFLIVLLSPGYFHSEYCAREFDWWMQHEMHRRVLGEGTAPILIVDVAKIYDFQSATIPDIPEYLQACFPNWLSQIRKIQSGPKFDIHNLDRAKISDVLNTLREEVRVRVQRQEAAEMSPHTGQYPAYNENFVGRRENLRSLRKSLSEKAAAPYCALTGLGGFGKTELALTYGHAFAWDYGLGRVFAKCENKTSISETILTSGIAEMHGWELSKGSEDQQITFLFNHLNAKRNEIVKRNMEEGIRITLGTHILLILDNVNNRKLISKNNLAILPDYFHVIITTRENTNDIPYIHTESVERLSEDESVELLCNLHPFANPDEAKAARDIAKLLAGFTLAVELTGAYLENNKYITYKKQYDRLVSNHTETFQKMADKTSDLTRHAAETVSAVLESTLSALPDNACKALEFASVMVPDTVALGWLPELCDLDVEEGEEVLHELTGYSLLTPLESEPNIARMHRLVAETVKQEIPENVQKEMIAKIREKCNSLLEYDEAFWCSSENFWNIAPVSEFGLMLAKRWTLETSIERIDWSLIGILCNSGSILNILGKIRNAKDVYCQLFVISEELFKKYPSYFETHLNLSFAYEKLGDMEMFAGNTAAAREMYEKAREIKQQLDDELPTEEIYFRYDFISLYIKIICLECLSGNTENTHVYCMKAQNIYLRMCWLFETRNCRVQDSLIFFIQNACLESLIGNIRRACNYCNSALKILTGKKLKKFYIQRLLSLTYGLFGVLENDMENVVVAGKYYEQGMVIQQRLAEAMPENVDIQRDLSIFYVLFGDWESKAGNMNSAKEWYAKALEIRQRLVNKMPVNVQTHEDLVEIQEKLARVQKQPWYITIFRKLFINGKNDYEKHISAKNRVTLILAITRIRSSFFDFFSHYKVHDGSGKADDSIMVTINFEDSEDNL